LRDGVEEVLPVDQVVLCAGQVSDRRLADQLIAAGMTPHVIGGADVAAELDAKRAIDQAARLAAVL
jgi:2,4-dienoyl-CoA reductase (NADPH2)